MDASELHGILMFVRPAERLKKRFGQPGYPDWLQTGPFTGRQRQPPGAWSCNSRSKRQEINQNGRDERM